MDILAKIKSEFPQDILGDISKKYEELFVQKQIEKIQEKFRAKKHNFGLSLMLIYNPEVLECSKSEIIASIMYFVNSFNDTNFYGSCNFFLFGKQRVGFFAEGYSEDYPYNKIKKNRRLLTRMFKMYLDTLSLEELTKLTKEWDSLLEYMYLRFNDGVVDSDITNISWYTISSNTNLKISDF